MKKAILAVSFIAAAFSVPASALPLLHSYDFDGTTVTDLVGTANGTLVGAANVSGGVLNINGGYAQLSSKIIPTDGSAFSLYFDYNAASIQPSGIVELISQGITGSGFYVGDVAGNIRLTDNFFNGVAPFLTGAHSLLLTSGGGNGATVFVDGTQVFYSVSDLTALGATGTDTRFGTQFDPPGGGTYGENFSGTLDNVRVFSGIASFAEASAVPEPATWAMMLLGLFGVGFLMRGARRNDATVSA